MWYNQIMNKERLKVLELFAGIGACSKALTNLGIPHDIVDAVEIDEWAMKSFNAIHGTNFEPQDITKWDKDIKCDLIMHGSPCQDFSMAGKQAGGDEGSGTRSSLMYETLRIVEKLKPKYVIWENVKNLLGEKHIHNFGAYCTRMRQLGYVSNYKVLNAKDYGIPQNRERVFVVSVYLPEEAKTGNDLISLGVFDFPEPMPLKKTLRDILDEEVDEKYYLTPEQTAKIKFCKPSETISKTVRASGRGSLDRHQWDLVQVAQMYGFGKEKNPQAGRIYDANGICPTIDTMSGGNRMPKIIDPQGRTKKVNTPKDYAPTLRAQSHGNEPCVVEEGSPRIRKLTAKECWRLMGFSDEDYEKAAGTGASATQLYKQAGNSICVNVLEEIFKNLLN